MPDSTYDANMAAASQLAVAAVNSTASATMNRNTRKWNEKQYEIQRANALSDWNMQNDYNSPQAQMERLRKAGLNPNLVYGNGATAQSESMPRQTDIKPWTPHAPQVDPQAVGSAVQQMYDVRIKEATYDNLRAQNTVIAQEAVLKDAQTKATLANAGLSEFDLGFKQESKQIDLQAKQANVDKTRVDTMYTLNQDERATAINSSSIQEAAERILRSRAERTKVPHEINLINAQIENLKKTGELQQLDIELKRMGLQPTDALWQRALGRILQGNGVNKVQGQGVMHNIRRFLEGKYEKK